MEYNFRKSMREMSVLHIIGQEIPRRKCFHYSGSISYYDGEIRRAFFTEGRKVKTEK